VSGQQGPAKDGVQANRDKLQGLSIRELEVLSLLVKGKSDFAIALALAISPGEVEMHVANILRILGLQNRRSVTAFWKEAMREDNGVRDSER
jgi:DNA-binding CsgD family transcriptional regulator